MAGRAQRERAAERNLALRLARERLAESRPADLAQRAGVTYLAADEGNGAFVMPYLRRRFRLSYPESRVEPEGSEPPAGYALELIMLHYLLHADGTPPADRWVAFRELPGGLVYDSALRGRAEPPLVAAFGARPERLRQAAEALGGRPLDFGDAAYAFQVFPRLAMAAVIHAGDDEFPPAARLLYDASAGRYLPTEDLAVLGGVLVGALLKAAPR